MHATASKYYTLQQATKHRTNSGIIPFVIAHEVESLTKIVPDKNSLELEFSMLLKAYRSLREFEMNTQTRTK